jgi:signal transduction histidine kinase
MNQLEQFIQTARAYGYLILMGGNVFLILVWWTLTEYLAQPPAITLAIVSCIALLLPILLIWVVSDLFLRPLRFVWQAILYISPNTHSVAAPEPKNIRYGKELVTNLVLYVYQLAEAGSKLNSSTKAADKEMDRNFVAENLPLPLVILDKNESVLFANQSFLKYIHREADEILGNSIYNTLDLSFMSDGTLDNWLRVAKAGHVTATEYWERVKLTIPGDKPQAKLFDLAAYYNKDNPDNTETMLVMFDHTKSYGRDDQAVNFVALAVHELRTPLTMLRGYIEVLEEETAGKLNPELEGFIARMKASAQQLATFVNNILNVARVDENQLVLQLQEGDWSSILQQTVQDLSLRAKVHGITLKTSIEDNLPSVGLDRVSIFEVLSNIVDNAIKYSGESKEIIISSSLAKNGLVETTIQDFGRGIPANAVPHLFEKFYRDRRNRQQVGGTGLGLYLSKTLVNAHGGNIWVRSKEGQGSTFGFTLVPYSQLAEEQKNQDNNGIVRNAHGWIKNHSMYRR